MGSQITTIMKDKKVSAEIAKDRAPFSVEQKQRRSICPQILTLTLNYLNEEDLANCKLVCQEWERWITLMEPISSASTVFGIPHIVEKIFKCLNKAERVESRLISDSFNIVAAKHLHLKPFLTDVTSKSILQIATHLQVEEIVTSRLCTILPKTDDGFLQCSLDRDKIKSLTFYEGVLESNKYIMLRSFTQIEELRYINTNNFLLYKNLTYACLKKLEISSSVYDENGSLRAFFTCAVFPVLETVQLFVQTRLDFLFYLEVHYFIATHLERTLKKLILLFGSDFMFVASEVTKMFLHLPNHINERFNHVSSSFENNKNPLDCRLKFLRCEGLSKFRLTSALHDNLKSLNPEASILFEIPDYQDVGDGAGDTEEDEGVEEEDEDAEAENEDHEDDDEVEEQEENGNDDEEPGDNLYGYGIGWDETSSDNEDDDEGEGEDNERLDDPGLADIDVGLEWEVEPETDSSDDEDDEVEPIDSDEYELIENEVRAIFAHPEYQELEDSADDEM